MKTVSIASGSKGNCTFIGFRNANILVDIGIPCFLLEERLGQLNIDPKSIDAILITHEHCDHCSGVDVFARKYKTKVFMHANGYPYIRQKLNKLPDSQIICINGSTVFINDVMVSAVPLHHNSGFCVSYSVSDGKSKVSIATDTGHLTEEILEHLSGSDILFLEANHDERRLLMNPNYSPYLKRLILSPQGHLSNTECGTALAKLVKTGVRQVILSHLSEENNTPEIAYTTVKNILQKHGIIEGENVFVDVAYQHKVGTVFEME